MFAAAAVHGAGLGDGLHQVLVVGIPPSPPADFWLAAAGDHSAGALVPAWGGEKKKDKPQITGLSKESMILSRKLYLQ